MTALRDTELRYGRFFPNGKDQCIPGYALLHAASPLMSELDTSGNLIRRTPTETGYGNSMGLAGVFSTYNGDKYFRREPNSELLPTIGNYAPVYLKLDLAGIVTNPYGLEQDAEAWNGTYYSAYPTTFFTGGTYNGFTGFGAQVKQIPSILYKFTKADAYNSHYKNILSNRIAGGGGYTLLSINYYPYSNDYGNINLLITPINADNVTVGNTGVIDIYAVAFIGSTDNVDDYGGNYNHNGIFYENSEPHWFGPHIFNNSLGTDNYPIFIGKKLLGSVTGYYASDIPQISFMNSSLTGIGLSFNMNYNDRVISVTGDLTGLYINRAESLALSLYGSLQNQSKAIDTSAVSLNFNEYKPDKFAFDNQSHAIYNVKAPDYQGNGLTYEDVYVSYTDKNPHDYMVKYSDPLNHSGVLVVQTEITIPSTGPFTTYTDYTRTKYSYKSLYPFRRSKFPHTMNDITGGSRFVMERIPFFAKYTTDTDRFGQSIDVYLAPTRLNVSISGVNNAVSGCTTCSNLDGNHVLEISNTFSITGSTIGSRQLYYPTGISYGIMSPHLRYGKNHPLAGKGENWYHSLDTQPIYSNDFVFNSGNYQDIKLVDECCAGCVNGNNTKSTKCLYNMDLFFELTNKKSHPVNPSSYLYSFDSVLSLNWYTDNAAPERSLMFRKNICNDCVELKNEEGSLQYSSSYSYGHAISRVIQDAGLNPLTFNIDGRNFDLAGSGMLKANTLGCNYSGIQINVSPFSDNKPTKVTEGYVSYNSTRTTNGIAPETISVTLPTMPAFTGTAVINNKILLNGGTYTLRRILGSRMRYVCNNLLVPYTYSDSPTYPPYADYLGDTYTYIRPDNSGSILAYVGEGDTKSNNYAYVVVGEQIRVSNTCGFVGYNASASIGYQAKMIQLPCASSTMSEPFIHTTDYCVPDLNSSMTLLNYVPLCYTGHSTDVFPHDCGYQEELRSQLLQGIGSVQIN